MQESSDRLQAEGMAQIAAAATPAELEEVRVALLGRKGRLTVLLRGLGDLPAEERPLWGERLNRLKAELLEALARRQQVLAGAAAQAELRACDLTLPGRPPAPRGGQHPLQSVLEEICDIFYGLGFDRSEGPDVELDYYNFTALNFPDDHPARDIQDTFYVSEQVCLRTHTSPVQVRTMERRQPPLACIFPGRVFRNESSDASHSAEFLQIEGLCVDTAVSMADLRDTVERFVQSFYGAGRATRFRPHFFPFTEPSVEVDLQCSVCRGAGCRICGNTGWIEIMGAGMVHPNVFAAVGYPRDAYTGFAFGFGIDRMAMMRYGITDIRLFYENDLRFLSQFRGEW
jgi:phenylalanyl-tRNA synthetase alpha chain